MANVMVILSIKRYSKEYFMAIASVFAGSFLAENSIIKQKWSFIVSHSLCNLSLWLNEKVYMNFLPPNENFRF